MVKQVMPQRLYATSALLQEATHREPHDSGVDVRRMQCRLYKLRYA